MPTAEQQSVSNKREFSRVQAQIPMEIRIVSPQEIQDLQSRVIMKTAPLFNPPSDVEDPQLAEWLRFLNGKLDTILRYLKQESEDTSHMLLQSVMISGGGISFTSPKPYSLSDILELKILLPSSTPQVLYIYCNVVQSEARPDGYFTALHFHMMDDAIRDNILRFVFEKEREILRSKRRDS